MFIPHRRKICPFGLRNIVNKYLSEDEVEDFAFWAFGDNYLEFHDVINFAKKWNELHGDIYMINMTNEINSDLKKMCELWTEYGKSV